MLNLRSEPAEIYPAPRNGALDDRGAESHRHLKDEIRRRVNAQAAKRRAEGSSSPVTAALYSVCTSEVLTLGEAIFERELVAEREAVDLRVAADKAKQAADKAAADAAWTAPALPVEVIESLLEDYVPRSLRALLEAMDVDIGPAMPGEEVPEWFGVQRRTKDCPRARVILGIDVDLDDADEAREVFGYAVGCFVCQLAQINAPNAAAGHAFVAAVGADVERRIVDGWTPEIPRSLEALSSAIRDVATPGSMMSPNVLARRLILFGADDNRKRTLRIARAYRVHIAAVRRDLDEAEKALEVIERGDGHELQRRYAAQRAADGTAVAPIRSEAECLVGVALGKHFGAWDGDPHGFMAAELFSRELLPHGHDHGDASGRYAVEVLAALAGTHVDELRLGKDA